MSVRLGAANSAKVFGGSCTLYSRQVLALLKTDSLRNYFGSNIETQFKLPGTSAIYQWE